jgi:hypothetical protein
VYITTPRTHYQPSALNTLALKDLSLVADDTGIVSKILMMLYIAGLKSRFLACSFE